jgi:putative transposase
MKKAYVFRLYPNNKQKIFFEQTFGCCRYVYNRVLAMRKELYKSEKISKSIFEYMKMLKTWKKQEETSWLKEADSQALKQSLRDLDRAFKNFFRAPSKIGYPKFKKKTHEQSYRTTNVKILDSNHIKLPKVGVVKARVSRELEGRPLSATVRLKPSGKYFVPICCTDVDMVTLPKKDSAVGVDLGIVSIITTSDGRKIKPLKATREHEKKLAREQKKLSRKKKGSNNWQKQRIKVARTHERVTNSRQDYLNKVTTTLVRENQTICVETLKVKNMMSNRRLARSIADASFGEITRQLEYKSKWYGRDFVRVSTWYPSSKLCNACGHKEKDMPLSVREWVCPECGSVHDRDVNAARNILTEGLRVLTTSGTVGHTGTSGALASVNACGESVSRAATCCHGALFSVKQEPPCCNCKKRMPQESSCLTLGGCH